MLSARNLTRRYGAVVAANNVSFDVNQGEIVGLLGHNGAGKSTIMKLLTGYIEPSAGSATVNDIDVLAEPERARAQIGYLPENSPLYNEMSVLDYLRFTANMRDIDASDIPERVREAIINTDLQERALDQISTLSRGFQQRVSVAQAILHRPRVLILDEPTNGLDPSQTHQMRRLIRDLSKDATVVLSTHIMQEVDAICDRVLIMSAGRLIVDERLEDLQRGNRILLKSSSSLEDIQSVADQRVSVQGSHSEFVLESRSPDTPVPVDELVRDFVNAGVSVHAISPERRNLEVLFREVSETDNAA